MSERIVASNKTTGAIPASQESEPVTFKGLRKRWRKGEGFNSGPIHCADELESLEPHYIHKDKVRELRDELLQPTNSASETRHNCHVADKLSALLGEP